MVLEHNSSQVHGLQTQLSNQKQLFSRVFGYQVLPLCQIVGEQMMQRKVSGKPIRSYNIRLQIHLDMATQIRDILPG